LNTALSGKQATVTLTTTGTSGASTFVANTLNVPTYSLSGLGGVPTSRTLTINGTTQDLSADRTFTISTGITIGTTAITSGTVGRVLFEGTGNVVQESANLFWDNTNGRLGIGTSSPSTTLSVSGIVSIVNSVGTNRSTQLTSGLSSDNFSAVAFYPLTGTNVGQSFQVIPKGTGFSAGIKAQFSIFGTDLIADGTNFEALVVRATGSAFTFSSGKGGTGTIRPMLFSSGFLDGVTNANQLWLYTTGNVGINTTTDAGYKLDVNGTARFGVAAQVVLGDYNGGGQSASAFKADFDGGWAWGISNLAKTQWYLEIRNGSTIFGSGTQNYLSLSASAKVQIDSTTRGFLPPRMTTTQKNAIASPATGLQIYDSTLNRPCFYDGTTWITL
jgi:hypothetical protein